MTTSASPPAPASPIAWLGNQPYLLLSLTSLFWAGNVVLARYVAGHVPPITLSCFRWFGTFLLLLPFAWPHLADVTTASLVRVVIGGVGPGTIAGIVFARGLARIGSARTAILTFAEPLVAVACGALVWDEGLHPLAALGGTLILGAGVYVARRSS